MSITTTTPAGRMASLARAELILLGRNKSALVAGLFVPLILPVSVRSAAEEMDLAEAGLTPVSSSCPPPSASRCSSPCTPPSSASTSSAARSWC